MFIKKHFLKIASVLLAVITIAVFSGFAANAERIFPHNPISEDSKTVVKEITFTGKSMSSVIALLIKNSSSDKFLLRLPAWINPDFGKSDVRESAMLLPVTERAKEIAPNINNAYLGLTLD